jgi:hypothetical protein
MRIYFKQYAISADVKVYECKESPERQCSSWDYLRTVMKLDPNASLARIQSIEIKEKNVQFPVKVIHITEVDKLQQDHDCPDQVYREQVNDLKELLKSTNNQVIKRIQKLLTRAFSYHGTISFATAIREAGEACSK